MKGTVRSSGKLISEVHVDGAWLMVHGWWYMFDGAWLMVYGWWCMVGGAWLVVHGWWRMVGALKSFWQLLKQVKTPNSFLHELSAPISTIAFKFISLFLTFLRISSTFPFFTISGLIRATVTFFSTENKSKLKDVRICYLVGQIKKYFDCSLSLMIDIIFYFGS